MARRIFLHIGVMKSATSYLQGLCEQNQGQLQAAGLYWCPGRLRYDAVRDLLGKRREHPNEAQSWTQLLEGLRRHPGDALLSNELLAGLRTRYAGRLVDELPDVEVHVVITARDLARIIPSHWQTTIKNGKTWSWSEFASSVCSDTPAESAGPEAARDDDGEGPAAEAMGINSWFWRRHDLPTIIARWADAVPLERITLVTVPPDSSDLKTVAARFGSVVGVDVVGLDHPDTPQNPTLGAHSVELLRRLNGSLAEVELDDPEHRFERALGGALAGFADLEPRFALTQSQQEWIGNRARAMIAQVEDLGLAVVGDLADLVPAATPRPGAVDPGDTTDAELLAVAARGLAALAPLFNELRAERDMLKRSLCSSQEEAARVHDQQTDTPARFGPLSVGIRRLLSPVNRIRSRVVRRGNRNSG